VTTMPDNVSDAESPPDISGSVRARKAFRLSVLGLFIFTSLLCFSELQLKYPQPETLYNDALTLYKGASRVFLVQAVRLDKERNETQNPKYIKALAVREENDKVLETYPAALELDAEDVLFQLRYVSRLLTMGRPYLALEQIAHIEELQQGKSANSLTGYLKAAALTIKGDRKTAVRNAMAEIARTNNSQATVTYPTPFWFSEYPKTGTQFADHTREITDEIIFPLTRLLTHIVIEIQREIRNGNASEVKPWLRELSLMGRNMYTDPDQTGVRQALFGIQWELRVATLSQEAAFAPTEGELNRFIEEKVRCENILRTLTEFEKNRDDAIKLEERKISQPTFLAVGTWFITFALWSFFVVQNRLWSNHGDSWTIPIGRYGKILIVLTNFLIVVLLVLMFNASTKDAYTSEFWDNTSLIWKYSIGVYLGIGLIYPFYLLSGYPSLRHSSEGDSTFSKIMSMMPRFSTWGLVTRRYYGMVFGWYTILMCLAVIGYYLVFNLFPWQFNLLSSGLLDVERDLVLVLTRG